jgi:uroporphyrinogen decarboxylase
MNYEKPDRLPFYQFIGYWGETINRWYGEGLPTGMTVNDYFGFDKIESASIDLGPIPSSITKIISEGERYKTTMTELGDLRWIAKRRKDGASMPQFIEFGVKSRKDWEKIKKRYDPKDLRRFPKTWGKDLQNYYNTVDHPVGIDLGSCFGWIRDLMGLKNTLINFYKDPDLIHEMMDFWADFAIDLVTPAVNSVKFDYANIWEDMAYKNGPHISPKLFREFMLPNYKKVTDFVKSKGIDIIMVDTDGNHEVLTPLFLEGGVNCLYPMEVAAGMNAISSRKKYGKELRILGNIDKRALISGKESIKKEVESKLPFFVNDLGYIPSIDHCVSADVSFENFSYYIKLVKEYDKEF